MRTIATLILLVTAGCGASPEPATTTSGTAPGTGEPGPAGPPEPWVEMDFDERRRYMGEHVLPAMTELFEEYDPGEFSAFSCDTCHGDDMRERMFAMPSPSLPALYPTGHPQQRAMVEEHPEMVRFMFNRVVPRMQQLLGAQPFDETTGTGFTCFACHPLAEDADAGEAEGGATE